MRNKEIKLNYISLCPITKHAPFWEQSLYKTATKILEASGSLMNHYCKKKLTKGGSKLK